MGGVYDRPRVLVIRTEKDEGDCVRLAVKDTGVGIPQQEMARLFDSFYTTKSDGMGIGLSVSRSIIESHHGRLWAEQEDGPGALFCFCIPVNFAGMRAPGKPADRARSGLPGAFVRDPLCGFSCRGSKSFCDSARQLIRHKFGHIAIGAHAVGMRLVGRSG